MLDVLTNQAVITDTTAQFNMKLVTGEWIEMDGQDSVPAASTGYGIFYVLAADGKPYFRASDGTIYNMGMIGDAPMVFKGSIATAANFPTVAAVQTGWLYRVTADVIDNDPTKTNTGQLFIAGAEIAWNGTNWSDLGISQTYTPINTTPYVVADAAQCIGIDTVTIGGPSVVTLPTAVGRLGKQILVVDATGAAGANNIAVTPAGAETINGVAAPFTLNINRQAVVLVSNNVGWLTLSGEPILALANTHRTSSGTDHSLVLDNHVSSTVTGLALETLGSKGNAALNGTAAKQFVPERCELLITAVGAGAQNGDAEIKIGTTDGGAEIMATHLVALTAINQSCVILMDGSFPALTGTATIYIEVSKADTSVTADITATARFIGRQY